MESKITLLTDHINGDLIDNIKGHATICCYSDVHDLRIHMNNNEETDSTIFGIMIKGEDPDVFVSFNIGLDQLEHFTKSILNQIEIVKSNYSEEIEFHRRKMHKL